MEHSATENQRGFHWGSFLLTLAAVILVIMVILLVLLAWFNHRLKEAIDSNYVPTKVTVTEASTTLPAPDGLDPELERVLDRSFYHDATQQLSRSSTEATVFTAETTEQAWDEPSALAAHIVELSPLLCDSLLRFPHSDGEHPTIVVKHPCAQELSPAGMTELLTLAGDKQVEITFGHRDPDLPLHDVHIRTNPQQHQEIVDKLRDNPAALAGTTVAVATDNDVTVVEIT